MHAALYRVVQLSCMHSDIVMLMPIVKENHCQDSTTHLIVVVACPLMLLHSHTCYTRLQESVIGIHVGVGVLQFHHNNHCVCMVCMHHDHE